MKRPNTCALLTALLVTTSGFADKPQNLGSGGNPLSAYKGHFQGSENDHTAGQFNQRSIKADIDLSKKDAFIAAQDESGTPVFNVEFVKVSDKDIQLRISALPGETRDLVRDGTCFSDKEMQTNMCFYDDGMDLEASTLDGTPVLSLSLSRFAQETPLTKAAPQEFTLAAAVQHALQMNFDSRIEFEHVIQAKQNARLSYLNLLPHLSMGTVVNNLTPNFVTVLSAASDLVPFLLPGRWLQAKRARLQSYAENQALVLMRMDTATLVEGLYYTNAHDENIRALYDGLLKTATVAREDVRIGEKMGKYATGSTDDIDSIVNSMTQDYTVFNQILVEDRAAVSQALGFYDPQDVSAAPLGTELVPIDQAKPLVSDTVVKAAVAQSFELKQIDSLMAAAKNSKTQLWFNWLDPVGDPTANLGFNLKANFAVADSQLREMTLKRTEMESALQHKAFTACTDYNQALTTYGQAVDGVAINQRRLGQIISFVKVGNNVDLFHILDIIQDSLAAGIRKENALAGFRVARGKIDRLLLQGYYAHPDKPISRPKETIPN